MTLTELADRIGARLEGDGAVEVTRVAGLEAAEAGDVTFLANPAYTAEVARTRASAVILGRQGPPAPCAILRADNPYLAFARAVQALAPPVVAPDGVHATAVVDPSASLGPGVRIGPLAVVGARVRLGARTVVHAHAVIGDETIVGDDCVLHAHVSIRERCRLGDRVIVQNGAVVGADGFGFARRADGTHEKIAQTAPVVVEDDVEIGANTTIDRPAVGETRIRAGAKIDNLVMIAHGVVIGPRTLVAAQVGISGSTTVGADVMLGGQVGVAGHLSIGDGVKVTGQSGITHSIPAGAFVSGLPAIDNREWRKAAVVFARLPELRQRLQALERRLAELGAAAGAKPTPMP